MIIKDWREKIKGLRQFFLNYEKEIFVVLLVVLSSSLSFGLGRLTKLKENQAPITITMASSTISSDIKITDEVSTDTRIVASKKGTKYYYPWCGGSKNIKVENLRYFTTAAAAEAAGYSRASNCSEKF